MFPVLICSIVMFLIQHSLPYPRFESSLPLGSTDGSGPRLSYREVRAKSLETEFTNLRQKSS